MASDIPDRPRFAIFAGPNGAGKTTAYRRFLDARYNAGEYLNPDDIAAKLTTATGTPAGVDLSAGRAVIRRTRQLIESRQPLTRETTLSGREILASAALADAAGFRVVMVFVGVDSTSTTKCRVAFRVVSGGHDIPSATQERRFRRSLDNAPRAARIVHVAYFLDNGGLQHRLVATVYGGTVNFLDSRDAVWVERATAGLPHASALLSRAAALAELRNTEGLSKTLQVRESRPAYGVEGARSTGSEGR